MPYTQAYLNLMAHVNYTTPTPTPYTQPGTAAPAAPNRSTTNTQTSLSRLPIS